MWDETGVLEPLGNTAVAGALLCTFRFALNDILSVLQKKVE